jgi:hypothetical protein
MLKLQLIQGGKSQSKMVSYKDVVLKLAHYFNATPYTVNAYIRAFQIKGRLQRSHELLNEGWSWEDVYAEFKWELATSLSPRLQLVA